MEKIKQSVIDARHSSNADPLHARYRTIKDKRYVNQVKILNKKHLVRGLYDESDEVVVAKVIESYGLNTEQDRAFRIVVQHSGDPSAEQLRMYIGGMGGTGKSRVLSALKVYFELQGEGKCLVVVAPTGTAAAIVKGFNLSLYVRD